MFSKLATPRQEDRKETTTGSLMLVSYQKRLAFRRTTVLPERGERGILSELKQEFFRNIYQALGSQKGSLASLKTADTHGGLGSEMKQSITGLYSNLSCVSVLRIGDTEIFM